MAMTDRAIARAASGLVALTRRRPRSRADARERARQEMVLLRFLLAGGLRAVERVVRAAMKSGLPWTPKPGVHQAGYRSWQAAAAGKREVLELRVHSSPALRSISLGWHTPRAPLTPSQQRVHDIQEAFYARYLEAGRRAYASPPRRISAPDATILLVGELEADVNNGGFSQYLHNKDRRRANRALKALRLIGARNTALLLERALAPQATEQILHKLDARFYRGRENLALLAARTFNLARP